MSFRALEILPVYKLAWYLVLLQCPCDERKFTISKLCVYCQSVSAAQELTAIHINLKGIASSLVSCFTQEVNCNKHPLSTFFSNCSQTSYC